MRDLTLTRPYHQGRSVAALLAVLTVAACATPDGDVEVFDPYESQNRAIHQFNRGFDEALLRPAANFYGETLPEPVRKVVGNVADNIELSGYVVNDLLQLEIDDAVHNTFRFIINTTLGIGGLFDPAASFGLDSRDTGFGETLYTWGAEEGAYIELPLLGPSTQREAVGRFADFFTNVFSYALDGPSAVAATGVGGVDLLNDRYEFAPSIDSVLYDSEDSYAASRILYLQNLRFNYSGGEIDEETTDIYDDLFAE